MGKKGILVYLFTVNLMTLVSASDYIASKVWMLGEY